MGTGIEDYFYTLSTGAERKRWKSGMRRRAMRVAIIIVALLAPLAGFTLWQYQTSTSPQLSVLHEYPRPVPMSSIVEPKRSGAEAQLRAAAGAVPGYRITDERFLATGAPFTWDALRHRLVAELGDRHYEMSSDGQTNDFNIHYEVYGHAGWMRDRFEDDKIFTGYIRSPLSTTDGREAVVYAYFRLTRN